MTLNWAKLDTLNEGYQLQTESMPEKKVGIDWNKMDTLSQPIEKEDKSYWQQFEKFTRPGEKEIQKRREAVSGIPGEVAGGLIRASAGLEGLIAAGVETVYDAGRIIGREAYKLATDTPESLMTPFEKTDYFTSNIEQAKNELLSKVLPEERTTAGKIIGRVSEYAAPTAATTRLFINTGKNLAKDPSKLSSNKLLRRFQESLITASKSPAAAHKLEQGVSAIQATVGQVLEESGFSPNQQLIGELITGIMAGNIKNTSESIKGWWQAKISKTARGQYGKQLAAEYLKNVADADPDFMNKLKRGVELSKKTGVKMNFAQLTNNNELKAALEALDIAEEGGQTTLDKILARQTKKIKEYKPVDLDAQDQGLTSLITQRDQELQYLEQKAYQTVDDLVDQMDTVSPWDKIDAGKTGQEMIDSAREAMDAKVRKLYANVGNPEIGTDLIKKGLLEAKKSPLIDDAYMRELDTDLKQVLEANVLGKRAINEKQYGFQRPAKLKGFKEAPKTIDLDQARTLESRLKEKIRIANANGERNKARILNKILDGIFDQYRTATGESAENITKLRTAAEESKRFHQIFSQGENLLSSKVDIQGMDKLTPEGFVRNYIRANDDTKVSRVETAVDNFYDAYGNIREAKDWMANSFGALLKDRFPNIESENPQRIMNEIQKHSRFLKRAGIEGRFKNLKQAINEANQANLNLELDKTTFNRSVVGKALGSDDPQTYIKNAIGTNKIDEIINYVDSIKDKGRRDIVKRGVKEMAWESIWDKLPTTKTVGGEIILDTGNVRKALESERYRRSLNKVLGKTHTKNLDEVLDTIDRIQRDPTKTTGLPKDVIDKDLAEKLMTGLRAAAHGFVRPDLIAAQMAKRGFKAYTITQAQNVLKEALENPKFAHELMNMAKTDEGYIMVKHLFTPLVSIGLAEREETE